MRISELKNVLNGELLHLEEDIDVERIDASDLMSDVLAFFEEGTALITSLVSPQVIRTAMIVGIPLVVFVKGKTVPDEVIEMARDNGISVIRTDLSMFETCGILYSEGMRT